MLDEPSLGLAPNLVGMVLERIVEINRGAGVTILIVEQKVRNVLQFSRRVYSMKLARTAFAGAAESTRRAGMQGPCRRGEGA